VKLIYQMFAKLLSWTVLHARSDTANEIEILVLRDQLTVLQRRTTRLHRMEDPSRGGHRLALLAQVCREPAGRGEGFGVVVAQHAAEADEGVVLEIACWLVLAHETQGEAEEAGCAQRSYVSRARKRLSPSRSAARSGVDRSSAA
jgi:hypothetical protein